MKERILNRWTMARVLYFILGVYIIVQSVINKEYYGIPIGAYFAAMGLFAFGCAAGNCYTSRTPKGLQQENLKNNIREVKYEEVN